MVIESFYTHFPTHHNFHKPYYSKSNLKGSEEAFSFINTKFHISRIHNDFQSCPDIAGNPIYKYTFIDDHLFDTWQWQKNHSINVKNALHQNQYAFKLCYSIVKIHPYLLQTIL